MKYKYTPEQLDKMSGCRWLTDRERAVLELYYGHGMQIEDIAAELYVSRSTVNNVLRSIRNKTATKNSQN